MWTVNSRLVAAMCDWTNPSGTNQSPALHGVVFASDKIWATDGSRLIVVPFSGGPAGPVQIAPHHLRGVVKFQQEVVPTGIAAPMLQLQVSRPWGVDGVGLVDISVDVRSPHLRIVVPMRHNENVIPDISKLIPKSKSSTLSPCRYTINPALMASIGDVNAAMGLVGGAAGVRLTSWGEVKAGQGAREPLLLENSEGVMFAIMPIRDPGA